MRRGLTTTLSWGSKASASARPEMRERCVAPKLKLLEISHLGGVPPDSAHEVCCEPAPASASRTASSTAVRIRLRAEQLCAIDRASAAFPPPLALGSEEPSPTSSGSPAEAPVGRESLVRLIGRVWRKDTRGTRVLKVKVHVG